MIKVSRTNFLSLSILCLLALLATWLLSNSLKNYNAGSWFSFANFSNRSHDPEISAWVAWWEEKPAYDLAEKYPDKISSLSPVWFMVDENLELSNISEIDRPEVIKKLKDLDIEIIPTLGSEISGKDLTPLFSDQTKRKKLVEDLVSEIVALNVDGIDIDLEGIEKEGRGNFSLFLEELSESMKKNDLKMTVAVHAQTGEVEWEGTEGQDLKRIGEIADEVRIMTYDNHSASSDPGAISPILWMIEVALYNSRMIDKDKIVIGIPSYGYIWEEGGDAQGLQFDEFNQYLKGTSFEDKRDLASGELVINSDSFTGWLSDSSAMIKKISFLRLLGFNKFIIWHLGGMDEKFFEKEWTGWF